MRGKISKAARDVVQGQETLLTIIFAAAFILTVFLLARFTELATHSWVDVLIATGGIFLTIALASLGAALWFALLTRNDRLISERARLELLRLDRAASPDDIVVSEAEIYEIERAGGWRQIWIITKDLHRDVPQDYDPLHEPFFRAIAHNLGKGIIYSFVVPEDPHVRLKVEEQLRPSVHEWETQVSVHFVPLTEWHRLPYYNGDIALFNPHARQDAAPRQAYFELPYPNKKVWIRTPSEIAANWTVGLRELIPRLGPIAEGVQA